MATTTTRLGLRKPDPDPSTGDLMNVTTDISNSMDTIDSAIGYTVCTSGTRPTGAQRWDGRQIWETDTRRTYLWSASVNDWLPLLNARTATGPYLLNNSTDTVGEGLNISGSGATVDLLRTRVGTETQHRFFLQTDGKMGWGPGAASPPDVNLYRSAADILKTDDSLVVAGSLTVQGGGTFVKIAENILGAATATVTFSSIPTTYRSLRVVWAARSNTAATFAGISLRMNGDSLANYDWLQTVGSGATTTTGEATNSTACHLGEVAANNSTAGALGTGEVLIPWYASTIFWKHAFADICLSQATGGAGNLQLKAIVSRWRSTTAVNSVSIICGAGSFITGSSFALYGLP